MIETLEIVVIVHDENERFEFRYEDEVVEIYLSGELICSMDWSDNLLPLFKRAQELWGE